MGRGSESEWGESLSWLQTEASWRQRGNEMGHNIDMPLCVFDIWDILREKFKRRKIIEFACLVSSESEVLWCLKISQDIDFLSLRCLMTDMASTVASSALWLMSGSKRCSLRRVQMSKTGVLLDTTQPLAWQMTLKFTQVNNSNWRPKRSNFL